jgi:hypothetical protein
MLDASPALSHSTASKHSGCRPQPGRGFLDDRQNLFNICLSEGHDLHQRGYWRGTTGWASLLSKSHINFCGECLNKLSPQTKSRNGHMSAVSRPACATQVPEDEDVPSSSLGCCFLLDCTHEIFRYLPYTSLSQTIGLALALERNRLNASGLVKLRLDGSERAKPAAVIKCLIPRGRCPAVSAARIYILVLVFV